MWSLGLLRLRDGRNVRCGVKGIQGSGGCGVFGWWGVGTRGVEGLRFGVQRCDESGVLGCRWWGLGYGW